MVASPIQFLVPELLRADESMNPGWWICQGHSQVMNTVSHNQIGQIMMHGNLNLHLNVCASERLTSEANSEFNHTACPALRQPLL
jgi:hypothetical protein